MMKRRSIITTSGLTLVVLLLTLSGLAQNLTRITGQITDESGNPMPGATIMVPATKTGTMSDSKGNYSVSVPSHANEMIVSFIGYLSQTISINSRTIINVTLQEDAISLENIEVYVGYGYVRKSDISGSVSTVKVSDTESISVPTLDNLLRGKAAGVQVTTSNAAPGGDATITIRGAGSFANNDPLYVVDGIILNPTEQGLTAFGSGQDGQGSQSPLLGLDPSDIVSMEILKDASATAIYGSLGASGVVLITTKTGTAGKPKVEFSSSFEMNRMAKKLDLLSFDEYVAYRHALGDSGMDGRIYDEEGKLKVIPVDWQDYCTRNAFSQVYRLNVSGKDDKVNYFISGGFSDINGIIKQTNLSVSSLRVNIDLNLSKNVKIGTKTSFAYTENSMTQGTEVTGSQINSLINSMTSSAPYYAPGVYLNDDDPDSDNPDAEGNPSPGNPIGWLKDYRDITKQFRLIPSAYLSANFLNKALEYKLTIGGDYLDKSRGRWYGNGTSIGTQAPNGKAGLTSTFQLRYSVDNTFNYNKTFGGKHRINAMVGLSLTSTTARNSSISMHGYDDQIYKLNGINSGSTIDDGYQYEYPKFSTLSCMTRAVYTYKDRYILTGTFRADGSSKFAKANKFSYFPAFSAKWAINREPFMREVTKISDLSLRVGWGTVGNQTTLPYQTLANWVGTMNPYKWNPGYFERGVVPENFQNENLKWETTYQYNAGIDIVLFKGRFSSTIDAYDKYTYGLLQNMDIPPSSGFSRIWVNKGNIGNRGLEISAHVIPVSYKKFSLSMGGNISFNRNKIISLGFNEGNSDEEGSDLGFVYMKGQNVNSSRANYFVNIYIEGKPMGLFWLYRDEGIIQQGESGPSFQGNPTKPGELKFVTYGDTDNVTIADLRVMGDPNPKFFYGFYLNLAWKKLSLDMNFHGVRGHDIYNANRPIRWDVDQSRRYNIERTAFYRAWTPDKPDHFFPALNSFGQIVNPMGRFLEDGSFLKLSSVILSYKLQNRKISNWVRGITFNAVGKNLFCWTNYSGYDPEVSSFAGNTKKMGIDQNSYPASRSYSLGISISF